MAREWSDIRRVDGKAGAVRQLGSMVARVGLVKDSKPKDSEMEDAHRDSSEIGSSGQTETYIILSN